MRFSAAAAALAGLALSSAELAAAQPVNEARLAQRNGHLELPRGATRMDKVVRRATTSAAKVKAAAAASSASKSKSLSLSKSASLSKSKSLSASKSRATSASKYSSSSQVAAAARFTSSSQAGLAVAASVSISSANARYSSSSLATAAALASSSRAAAAAAAAAAASTSSSTTSSTSTSSTTTTTSSTTTTTTTSSSTTTTSSTTTSKIVTTTTAAPVCAPKYTGAATTISGTGTLPKPSAFVKRSGQQLTLSGKTYRIAGPNIYWLCQDENIAGVAKGTPTDKGRVREALAMAVAMGANTVRLTSCGVSVGSDNSLQPGLNTVAAAGSDVWDIHDYVIYAAGQYGLRVILPLTDDYNYYTGGKYTFLNWLGVSSSNFGNAFFTNSDVIAAFKSYIGLLLTHQNPYTGKTWANDPTIMAYETGNEFGAYMGQEGYPPASFTSSVATYIRSLTPALIIDGSDGFYNYSTKATSPSLSVSAVDIMTDHQYPRNTGILATEVSLAANANKNFLIGEYDWNSASGTSLSSYLSAIEAQPYLGDMLWNLMGKDAECCAYVTHSDGFSLYYPNGLNTGEAANILAITKHWHKMTGRTAPTKAPAVACPQPVF